MSGPRLASLRTQVRVNDKKESRDDIFHDVFSGDIEKLKTIPKDKLLSASDQYENNLLHISAQMAYIEITKFLLGIGIEPKQKNKLGISPYEHAMRLQNKEIIDLFMVHEFDKKIEEKNLKIEELKKEIETSKNAIRDSVLKIVVLKNTCKRLREKNSSLVEELDSAKESNKKLKTSVESLTTALKNK